MDLSEYIGELEKVELLSPEKEAELWHRYKELGDDSARRLLIESYQPLVFRCAMPYRGMDSIMDIIQEGTVGLIEAAETFNPSKGVAFSLYGVHRIKGRMKDFRRKERLAGIPCLDGEDEEGFSYGEQIPDTGLSVQEQAELHELSGELRLAMDRLPSRERLVLEGVCFRSETAGDLARGLDLSLSHVYKLKKTGIRRVRGMLSKFMHHWK